MLKHSEEKTLIFLDADSALVGWTTMRWLLFVTMASYLLFAHGCHSDADTELLSPFSIVANS